MARRRMIDPSIWDDETVGLLSDKAFRLFVAMFSNADDDGKLEASPRKLRAIAFKYDEEATTADVELLLAEIDASFRSVQLYTVDDRQYAIFHNWRSFQRVDKPQKSRLPNPPEPFQDHSENGLRILQDDSDTSEVNISEVNGDEGADAPDHSLHPIYRSDLGKAWCHHFTNGNPRIPQSSLARDWEAVKRLEARDDYSMVFPEGEDSAIRCIQLWREKHPDKARESLWFIIGWAEKVASGEWKVVKS